LGLHHKHFNTVLDNSVREWVRDKQVLKVINSNDSKHRRGSLKQDTTLQIRINGNYKKLIQEQLGEVSISDYIRSSLNKVLESNRGWTLDEHKQSRG
jgi:hypothetical protein